MKRNNGFIFLLSIGLFLVMFVMGQSFAQNEHGKKKITAPRVELRNSLKDSINRILEENDKLHKLFFESKEKEIKSQVVKEITAVKSAFENITLKDKHGMHLKEILNSLLNHLAMMNSDLSFEDSKIEFSNANQQLAQMIRAFNLDSSYHIFYCPMEMKPWVAKGTVVNNPYAPKAMPHCGELKF